MKYPLVSVGLPVRNGEFYLEEAILSILRQNYSNFELIISDNASNDETEVICRDYASMDHRIIYNRFLNNVGAATNFNFVFLKSRGKYFKWAAYDDLCQNCFLTKCINAFSHNSDDIVLVYPKTEIIDEKGSHIKYDNTSFVIKENDADKRLVNFIKNMGLSNQLYGLIKSSCLKKTRLISPFNSSDFVLLVELLLLGRFFEIDDYLFKRRIHSSGSQFKNRSKKAIHYWFSTSDPKIIDYFPKEFRLRIEFAKSVLTMPLKNEIRIKCIKSIFSTNIIQEIRNVVGRAIYKNVYL